MVLHKCLGIVRCDKLHTYALLRNVRGFYFLQMNWISEEESKNGVCRYSVLYTSFVHFLLCHVVI